MIRISIDFMGKMNIWSFVRKIMPLFKTKMDKIWLELEVCFHIAQRNLINGCLDMLN